MTHTPGELTQNLNVSYEFFPPKTDEMEERLWESIRRLEVMGPRFVSVTYGAGGSTRDRTHRTVRRIVEETQLKPAAHLTCVSATREEVDEVIREYWDAGVRHIVALRGDPPQGLGEAYMPHPGGYANATELTAGIKAIADFEVSVGCYPEVHPESTGLDHDLDVLKAKVDAGASRAITQFFFEPETFLRYRDAVAKAGLSVTLVPGIMLQPNFVGLKRMAGLCGANIPAHLDQLYAGLEDDAKTRELITANVAAKLCERLAAEGVKDFHFYTLNRAELSLSTCHLLGVKPVETLAA
ncbi:methylenetetrahydrofolate reductase [NAD(P)H] [Woodsholea maritima]|uniref:methylenetetrahydrofolate reductase [NAD(P)H] n=1 Tax=Woodsholea maritima TaxID=240237 RepID=UPI000376A594|nr:methylenetetrahydrofolate reductase [NAD(P)H] [Woodsholea maritima]